MNVRMKPRIFLAVLLTVLLVLTLGSCVSNLPNGGEAAKPTEAASEMGDGNAASSDGVSAGPAANFVPGDDSAVSAANTTPIAPGTTFDNPWRYCEAVSTIDSPGIEYVGEKPNGAVVAKTLRLLGVPESDGAGHTVVWRCMDGLVYGCDVTLTGTCLTKLSLLTQPTQRMIDECARGENDGAALPEAVTGADTPYEWGCVGSAPAILRQRVSVDAQDFDATIWKPVYEN
ncbi:hypothetical protein BEQ56_01120 [Anaerolineaceae bacterium oral taxon 439]|nr:hypothetical protein BEQ56_01120 [Anaerolineaceae bacterium oral taxon 439]